MLPRSCSIPLLLTLALAGCGDDGASTADASTADAAPLADAAPDDPMVDYTEDREPCAERSATRVALFGDLHVHTTRSLDAYGFGTRTTPADAYRFAAGEEIPLSDADGIPRSARLDRPLDFAAVTDHGEFLGETDLCSDPDSDAYERLRCSSLREGSTVGVATWLALLADAEPSRVAQICGDDGATCIDAARGVWEEMQLAAEDHYDRTAACTLTTFVGYEWTGSTAAANLHRNVIFRNATVPGLPTSYFEESTAAGLWTALRDACIGDCDVLAIPHNPNLSSGQMFAAADPAAPVDEARAAAELRAAMEPVMELTQHKGTSECSPLFSSDEECGFEITAPGDALCGGDGDQPGSLCVARSDYARGALLSGMQEEARLGVNPFRLGFIGSTDTHNGTPGATAEDGFQGHAAANDDTPAERLGGSLIEYAPGGLAGVWAVENSRDAIFEALRRREVFATSGPRIQVRLFAGWAYPDLCADGDWLTAAYADGVPMGGEMPPRPADADAPRLVVSALADRVPLSAVQIVKGTVRADGSTEEQVYDVVTAGEAGTVDPATCEPAGDGLQSPCALWVDPDFDPDARSYYYARILEQPTCRWSTHDCNALPPAERPSACSDPDVAQMIRERAWSSPIWYAP